MTQLNQSNSEYRPKEEIDIIDVIRYCYNGIKSLLLWLWNGFLFCTIYLARKSLWLLLFVIIGMAIAFGLYKNGDKVYASSAIISSNNLESSIIISNIKNLDYLFLKKDYAEIAKILNISDADAAKIHSLTGLYGMQYGREFGMNKLPSYYAKEYAWQDTNIRISPNYFMIKSEVYDEDVYPALSKSLLRYISNNAFTQQANVLREEQLKAQVANTNQEIIALQQAISSYNTGATKTVVPIISDKVQKSELTQMQESLNKLYEKKNELERSITLFMEPATIVSDFSKTYRPANRLIRNYLAPWAVSFFVVGLLLLITWDNRKKIKAAVCEQ